MNKKRYFVSEPVRRILGDSSNKIKHIVDQYDNGKILHIDERKLNMTIYRMCSLSLDSSLPGYSKLDIEQQRRLIDDLSLAYFDSTCCNWSFYRGDRNYVFVNTCNSTEELLGEITHFFEKAEKIIQKHVHLKRINLADYLWFSVGRSHEEFGELLILPAKPALKHYFHVAEHLPSTSSVIIGAILARQGAQVCRNKKIYSKLASGEILPIMMEADSAKTRDMEIEIKEKGVRYAVSFVPKTAKRIRCSARKKTFSNLEDKYLKRFIDDTFFDFNLIKAAEEKQKINNKPNIINLSFPETVLVGVDMAGYSNLVSKIDSLYELGEFLNQRKSFIKYSAMNTHTLLFGMQTLLTNWLDFAVTLFSDHGYYSGEFGGDGFKAVKPSVSVDKLEQEIAFAAEISLRFDNYLSDLRESNIYSEAKVAAHYINDVSKQKKIKPPFMKVAVDYGSMIYNLRVTESDTYAFYSLNNVEGGEVEELLRKLKHQVLSENSNHYKTAISRNVYEILSSKSINTLSLTEDEKYGYFAQKKK